MYEQTQREREREDKKVIRKYTCTHTRTGWFRKQKANNGFDNSLTAWVQSEMLGWLEALSLPCLQYLNAVAYVMPW